MSDNFQQLDYLVEKKTVYYGQLIDILNEEWRHIGENSLDHLETLLARKETLLITIQELNIQREQVVRQIATEYNLNQDNITLKEIISIPDNPHKSRLQHFRRVLRSQIDSINRINQANRKLVRQSARTVKESIEYLVETGPQYTPYNPKGDLADAPLEGRMVRTSA